MNARSWDKGQRSNASTWRWNSLTTMLVHEDKYAIRYVRPLQYRVVAFKYYKHSCKFSDTVALYYEHYASWSDTVQAAKNWCLRGELERGEMAPYELASQMHREPIPAIERPAW